MRYDLKDFSTNKYYLCYLLQTKEAVMSFTFKHFHINDERCAMKVGTDGVLLGAWAEVADAKRILDIGCGCGLISLMAAQRSPKGNVLGIEIDNEATVDAINNVKNSPYSNRITITCTDALQFAQTATSKFDCILSNPPYYEEDVLPPSVNRAQARHTAGGGLTFNALLRCVSLLLDYTNKKARFCVILPTVASTHFICSASIYGLSLIHRTDIVTRPQKPCKRVLLCFSPTPSSLKYNQLVLIDKNGERSEQYRTLCKDFYIR